MISKILAILVKTKNTKINKIRAEKGITIVTNEIQKISKTYLKNLYSIKLENLKGMNGFRDAYNLSKLNQKRLKLFKVDLQHTVRLKQLFKICQLK